MWSIPTWLSSVVGNGREWSMFNCSKVLKIVQVGDFWWVALLGVVTCSFGVPFWSDVSFFQAARFTILFYDHLWFEPSWGKSWQEVTAMWFLVKGRKGASWKTRCTIHLLIKHLIYLLRNFIWWTDSCTRTSYCCGWPMVKLVATIWVITACVIFSIYFIQIFDYHRVKHFQMLKSNFHGGLTMVFTDADMPHGKQLLNWYFGVEPRTTLHDFNLIVLLVSVKILLKALGSTLSLLMLALWRYYQQGIQIAKWIWRSLRCDFEWRVGRVFFENQMYQATLEYLICLLRNFIRCLMQNVY